MIEKRVFLNTKPTFYPPPPCLNCIGVILGHTEMVKLRSYFIAPPTGGRINPGDNSNPHL